MSRRHAVVIDDAQLGGELEVPDKRVPLEDLRVCRLLRPHDQVEHGEQLLGEELEAPLVICIDVLRRVMSE